MSDIDTQAGNPEVVEVTPEPYVIDPVLCARLFWAGLKAAETHVENKDLIRAFQGVIFEDYPSVEKFEESLKLRDAFMKVMREAKRDGRV